MPRRVKEQPTKTAGELFGSRLRELRLARDLTQQSLADRAGVPHTHVSAMERGVKVPTLMTVLRLARALDCRPSKLVAAFDNADLESLLSR